MTVHTVENPLPVPGSKEVQEMLYSIKEKFNLENVSFYSSLSTEDFIRMYQTADIFLFPFIHDELPKVTLEAATCGLPIIAFKNHEPESVLNGKTGFIVKNIDEMYEKLEMLITDKELRETLGKNATEFIKKFDWDIIVKKWEKFFLEVTR